MANLRDWSSSVAFVLLHRLPAVGSRFGSRQRHSFTHAPPFLAHNQTSCSPMLHTAVPMPMYAAQIPYSFFPRNCKEVIMLLMTTAESLHNLLQPNPPKQLSNLVLFSRWFGS